MRSIMSSVMVKGLFDRYDEIMDYLSDLRNIKLQNGISVADLAIFDRHAYNIKKNFLALAAAVEEFGEDFPFI